VSTAPDRVGRTDVRAVRLISSGPAHDPAGAQFHLRLVVQEKLTFRQGLAQTVFQGQAAGKALFSSFVDPCSRHCQALENRRNRCERWLPQGSWHCEFLQHQMKIEPNVLLKCRPGWSGWDQTSKRGSSQKSGKAERLKYSGGYQPSAIFSC